MFTIKRQDSTQDIQNQLEELERLSIKVSLDNADKIDPIPIYNKFHKNIDNIAKKINTKNVKLNNYKNKVMLLQNQLLNDQKEILHYKKSMDNIDNENHELINKLKTTNNKIINQQNLLKNIKQEIEDEKYVQNKQITECNTRIKNIKLFLTNQLN